MDMIAPDDQINISPKSEMAHYKDKRWNIPLYTYIFLETATWIWALIVMSDVEVDLPGFRMKPETNFQYFCFVLQFGYFTGIATACGHELYHRKEWYDKLIGIWTNTKFFNTHYILEHIQGHHKQIATLEDPATARKGETVYAFWFRSVVTGNIASWKREHGRIKKTYGDDVSYFRLVVENRMFQFDMFHLSMMVTIYCLLGLNALIYQFWYTVVGSLMLEIINYVEHYGILRKKDENGIYESISKFHSWNARSSPILFRLQRHSDHHAHSFRPYQILRRLDDAPYHPFEYLHAFVITLIPPLWFYCVDSRVEYLREMQEGKEVSGSYDFVSPLNAHQKRTRIAGNLGLVFMQALACYFAFF